jgi:hypothetical protein
MAATSAEIDAYIRDIRDAYTTFGDVLSRKQRLGRRDVYRDKVKLMLLSGFLDCISDYFLQDPYEDYNFFTAAEIRDIMQHINNICDTNYIIYNL